MARSPMVTPQRITAPLPIDAPRFTTMGTIVQSASDVGAPWPAVARGMPIVDEHHAVADEDLVLDRHAFADERMRFDLAARADRHALLDLDERADAAAVAHRAAVQVDEIGMKDRDP
jgi:hypothetical protein